MNKIPRRSKISDRQNTIVAAALELLDEDGLENLTLRKLAARLGVQAPAIYWHFKNKTALIDYMAEAILKAEFADLQPRPANEPWQDWLTDLYKRLRLAMHAHRDGGRVVAGAHLFPAITLLRIDETATASLVSAGLELQRANLIVSTAIHFVFGRVIEEQSSPSPEELKTIDPEEFFRDFPYMAESLRLTLKEIEAGHDEFEEALRLIIGYPDAQK